MASTFGGISLCSTGLYNSQTNLYTANVNINNAGTTGYSRQVISQQPGYTTTITNGVVAVGINPGAVSVEQARSEYLDQRYWAEQPALGEWEGKNAGLSQMESILNELDETGIIAGLDDLNQSLEALSTEPQSTASKSAVVQDLIAVCDTLNNEAQQLYDLQSSILNEVNFTVSEINQKSAELASLNEEILFLELSGGNASALMDQRNLLTDELSYLTDITVTESTVGVNPNGQSITSYTVQSGNSILVSGKTYHPLETTEVLDVSGMRSIEVSWSESDQPYDSGGGYLEGNLDLLNGDGTAGSYKGIPYYMNALDEFALTLVTEMNAIHETAYNQDNTTGISLLDASSTTALSIRVSDTVSENPETLALSTAIDEAGNTTSLNHLIDKLNDSSTFGEGSFNDYINKITVELGADISYGVNKSESSTNLTTQIDLSRMSVSGVSIDEEMTAIVLQQQIYDATAKMMQMWNEVINTTITQLGG